MRFAKAKIAQWDCRKVIRSKIFLSINRLPFNLPGGKLYIIGLFCLQTVSFGQSYDILLKSGHVIDPKNSIDGPMDVANTRFDGTQKLVCELTILVGDVIWDLNGISIKA